MRLTLCISLYALHSMQFTLCTSLYALHSMLFTPCTSLYALHSMPFALCTSLYALHSLHFTLCGWVRGLRTEEPFAMLSGKQNCKTQGFQLSSALLRSAKSATYHEAAAARTDLEFCSGPPARGSCPAPTAHRRRPQRPGCLC